MKCERCKKDNARTIFQNQKLCAGCLCYVKGELAIFKDYRCVICKDVFNTMLRPFIPLCSKRCRDEFNRRLKCFEEAFEREYGAFRGGGE